MCNIVVDISVFVDTLLMTSQQLFSTARCLKVKELELSSRLHGYESVACGEVLGSNCVLLSGLHRGGCFLGSRSLPGFDRVAVTVTSSSSLTSSSTLRATRSISLNFVFV